MKQISETKTRRIYNINIFPAKSNFLILWNLMAWTFDIYFSSIHSLKYLRCLRHRVGKIWKVENQSLGQRLNFFVSGRISWMEASSYLPLLLWDGRRVLPLRRADLRHEVRKLDLRRIPGTVFSLKTQE